MTALPIAAGATTLTRTQPVAPSAATDPAGAVRVMICDDSAVIRGALARILGADPDIAVVARVDNGKAAIDQLPASRADVVVLDIEMPVMDGLTALPGLLKVDPGVKIIMASTLTTRGANVAMQSLRLGAADYVPKPSSIDTAGDSAFRRELLDKVKTLGRLRRRLPMLLRARPPIALRPAPARPARLLAVGSSTGGPQALFTLVQGLGRSIGVPVVLTQHMPATFTSILADHLNRFGLMHCAEACDGETLVADRIYLAPGDKHLLVERTQTGLRARLTSDPQENFCRPSVDPMLRSAAVACEGRVLVAMLTGMGRDGLNGTGKVIEAGGGAVSQDEATSVVWGMPGAIAQAGLCHAVLPLPQIAPKLLEMLRGTRP